MHGDPFQKSRVITSSTLICFLPVPRHGIEIPASTTRNCGSKRGTEQRDGIRNARRASFHRCREGERRRRREVATGRQVAKRNTNRNPNTGTKGRGEASWWTVIEVQGPWKWELRRSFGGDGRNDPRKNRETRMEGKRCNGKFQRKRGKKRNGGKRNRTDVEIEKEFWARIPGICGRGGQVFIVTVFRVLNVGECSNA